MRLSALSQVRSAITCKNRFPVTIRQIHAHKLKFMGISRDSFVMISAARASQTGRTEAAYFRPLP